MTDRIFEKIISTKNSYDHLMPELRRSLTGNEINTDFLPDLGYKKINKENSMWSMWVKIYNNKSQAIALKVSESGIIGAVESLYFHDLYENFGMGAPFGYYRYGGISKLMMNRTAKELSSITIKSISDKKDAVYLNYFRDLIPDYDMNNKDFNRDMAMGYLINTAFSDKLYDQCALLLFSAGKFSKEIDEPFLLADMAYFFGLLDFKDEFSDCIERMLEFTVEWDDTVICNIGTVLCDNFERYDLALECFFEALEINPKLPQAKQNVFVAGKFCIRKLACSDDTVRSACDLGEKIIVAGAGAPVNHGFYSYLGLAYECSGDKTKAEYYYKKALKSEKNCSTSAEGLNRIHSADYNINNAKRAVRYLEMMQPVVSHQKEDLLFYSRW